MKDLTTVMNKLEKLIRERKINCFKIAGYKGGDWQSRTITTTLDYMNGFSVAKTFTATAIGIAQDQGLLNVEDALLSFFGAGEAGTEGHNLEGVTIWHLLTHTTGIDKGYLHTADRSELQTDDWLGYCLSRPLTNKPGEGFMYSNSNFYLLSRIIRKVSGKTMDVFLYEHLLKPLKIEDCAFTRCPKGEVQGGTGMFITTRDMAKLGVLYLYNGMWDDRCILSEEWVHEATRNQIPHIQGKQYGFGIPVFDKGFYFYGALMQFVVVFRDLGLALAGHSCEEDTDLLALVHEAIA